MNKIKGFSLIEMILVLGLSSLSFVGLLNYEKRKTENLKAESVGQQFEEVGKALSSYIVRESSTLSTTIPLGTTATIPLTVLQGTTSGVYIGREYLPSTYSPTSGFGIDYVIQIRNNGPNSLTGMVVSNLPVTDETGQVRYDWIGHAIRKAGSQAGSAFFTGTSITGLNGGWNITNTTFPAITTAGQIAYRSQYQNNYDDIYLRRDGALPMTGNLNMGNFNIANATDISYNGWLYGNNALINNLKTGYILNTGNMRNEGNMQVVGSGSFDSIYVTNGADTGNLHNRNYMQNDGTLYNKGYMQNDGNMAVVGPNGLYVASDATIGGGISVGANNRILGNGSQGPYGATTIAGQKNGWTGLEFRDSGGNYQINQMTNRGNVGYYDAAIGRWLSYSDTSGNMTLDQTFDFNSGRLNPGWAIETYGCTTGQIAKAAYTVADGWAYNGKTLSCVNGVWKAPETGLSGRNWTSYFVNQAKSPAGMPASLVPYVYAKINSDATLTFQNFLGPLFSSIPIIGNTVIEQYYDDQTGYYSGYYNCPDMQIHYSNRNKLTIKPLYTLNALQYGGPPYDWSVTSEFSPVCP